MSLVSSLTVLGVEMLQAMPDRIPANNVHNILAICQSNDDLLRQTEMKSICTKSSCWEGHAMGVSTVEMQHPS